MNKPADRPLIVAILGSTAEKSANRKILEYLQGQAGERYELVISDWPVLLRHFNPDYGVHDLPVEVGMFREEIEQADAVLFCTPEYVFSVPGIVKNAIEWTVSTTLFSEKPVAVITASSAGETGHASLIHILRTLYAELPDERALLISGVKARIDAHGAPTEAELSKSLETLIESLVESTEKQSKE